MCGPIDTRSTWMVERHLKSLNSLVRERELPKYFVVEGYMVYQTMVYIFQYLPKLAVNMNAGHIWDVSPINKFEREYLLGKGRMMKVKGN